MKKRVSTDERMTYGRAAGDVHRLIDLQAPEVWDAALDGIPHAFAHTRSWCRAMQRTTGVPTRLYCFTDEHDRVVCPIVERSYAGKVDVVTPPGFSGFVGPNPARSFPRAWIDFARRKGYVCGYIGLHPILTGVELVDPGATYTYNTIYVLDLTLGPDELLRRLSTKRRRELRDWDERRSKNIICDRERLVEFYLAHHRTCFEQRRASAASFLSEEALCELFEDPRVVLVGGGNEGRLEAVTVFAYTPTIADALFNVSTPEGRQYSALLIWYGVCQLASLGVPMLNLGGGIRPADGVAEFKRRFNPGQYPLQALKQVFDLATFESICRKDGVDPTDRAGFFPPYRSHNSHASHV